MISLKEAVRVSPGLLRWHSDKEFTCPCRRHRFDAWGRKIPWRRKWHPTPVLLPGKFHGPKNLTGYSTWGLHELDTTEILSIHVTCK